jgi:hypothetical protein
VGDFHSRFLSGKKLAIACPKLDSNQQTYLEKLLAMINGGLNTLSVIVMEVPCCQSSGGYRPAGPSALQPEDSSEEDYCGDRGGCEG